MSARRRRVMSAAGCSLVLALMPLAALATGAGSTSAGNLARAQSEAPRLLGLLQLPVGAVRSANEPAGDHGVLAQPGYDEATPNLVDAHAWWTVPGTASGVLAQITARLPPNAKLSTQGSGNEAPGYQTESFSLPVIPGVLSERVLAVTAEQLNAHTTAIRTDGEAVWVTVRPAWEQIPPGVSRVTYTASGPSYSGTPGRASTPVTVRGARVRRLVGFVNGLALVQPGARACPAAFATYVHLRFLDRRAHVLALAVEEPSGCAYVNLTVGNRPGPALNDYPSVTGELERLGVVARCTMRQLVPSASLPGRNGAPGSQVISFTFRNRSRSVCRTSGFPEMRLLDARDRAIHTRSSDLGVSTVRGEGLGAWAVLDPGQSASFSADFTSCAAPTATRVRIRLPHLSRSFILPVGSSTHPFAPCHGQLGLSNLR